MRAVKIRRENDRPSFMIEVPPDRSVGLLNLSAMNLAEVSQVCQSSVSLCKFIVKLHDPVIQLVHRI
jgi:hypothetical protein